MAEKTMGLKIFQRADISLILTNEIWHRNDVIPMGEPMLDKLKVYRQGILYSHVTWSSGEESGGQGYFFQSKINGYSLWSLSLHSMTVTYR